MSRSSRARGWTLLELLIVVAIVAILVTLAWPSWHDTVDRTQARVRLQLLSEMIASVQLQHASQNLELERMCEAFYQTNEARFRELNMTASCQYLDEEEGQFVVTGTGNFDEIKLFSGA